MATNVVNKNQEMLLTIKRLGINGEGIGYYKRLAVFVPFALPTEEVVVNITDVNEQYAKGKIVRIKEKSPARIKPTCPYYELCGGCQLLHLEYSEQGKMKLEMVKEAFHRYYDGELNEKLFKDMVLAKNPWHYRNKAKLPVRYDGEKLVTGLYAFETNKLVYIENCEIEKEDIRKAVKEICEYLTRYQIIAYNPKTKEGVLRHLVLRSSSLTKEIQVTLILYSNDERTIKIAKDLIKIENIVSVYVSVNNDLSSMETFGETVEKIAGEEFITEQLGEYKFSIYPETFFPLNIEQAEELYRVGLNMMRLKGYEKVVDANCGVGTTGIMFSKHCSEIRGIDANKDVIKYAIQNAQANNIENARFYSGDTLSTLTKWANDDFFPDVLIVAPTRMGLELRLLNYLQNFPIKKILYLSSNPSTLAKNCNHLQKKYHILQIQPLDMFPQTALIETAVLLERR